jgi:hypothetical protein
MANTTFNVPRSHLTMALCLPLAVLLGYVLAEPLDSGSMAVVVFVLVILSVPLFMKWHHPLLVLGWNATLSPQFLPGHAGIWLYLTAISLFFAILNRATNPDEKFLSVPSITRPLLALAAVVVATGVLSGGFGSRLLGSSQFGGGRYYYLLGAIAGYFALTCRPIRLERASVYVGMFFLSGLTALISNLAYMAGPGFYFLYILFDPAYAVDQARASLALDPGIVRFASSSVVSPAIFCWCLARYGLKGMLDLSRPWRLLLVFGTIVGVLFGGFRSSLVLLLLTLAVLFFLEGLHRTKYLFALFAAVIIGSILLIPMADKLPLSVQRSLSVLPLPLNLDSEAKLSAEISSQWRVEMWKQVIPEIPKYLLRGKGYGLDPQDVEQTDITFRGSVNNQSWAGAKLMGDYHNGPLSVIISFGIYGCVAFVWFLFACHRLMWRYLKSGHPSLRNINALIFASFAAKTILFFFVFGALHTDMVSFAGLIGLSVALNAAVPAPEPELEASELEVDLNRGLSPSS